MPTVKPTAAAKKLSDLLDRRVSPSTLRGWCTNEQIAPFLSDSATPPKGETRLLTDHDLVTLARVAELRRQGKSFDEVGIELTKGVDGAGDVEIEPLKPTETPHGAIVPDMGHRDAATLETLIGRLTETQGQGERVAVVEDRTAAHADQLKTQGILIYILMAIMIGVLILLLVILVFGLRG